MVTSAKDFNEHFASITKYIQPSKIDSFLQYLKIKEVSAGEQIIRDGEASSTLYFVKSGLLLAYIQENGETIELGNIKPGEYTGEISFFDEKPAAASVKAVEACSLYVLSRDDFSQLEKEHPSVSSNLMRSISNLIISRTLETSSTLFNGLNKQEDGSINIKEQEHLSDWLVSIYGALQKH